jgi:protein-S-isoprenylcysteine O-methyltransferase Ste14
VAEPTDRTATSWHTPDSPYTVHKDAALATAPPAPDRRRFDPLALLVGLVSLAVAVLAVVAPGTLASVDPRWVLAGAAVVVGAGALLTTVRRRR